MSLARTGRKPGDFRAVPTRTAMLTLLAGGCFFLVPWTGYLARTLPAQHGTSEWRAAWVGFDVGLWCCFAVSTAARHRDELGPWGKGSRGTAYLTESELARFNDEYLELLLRYSLRHDRPGPALREVALRFYAFPQSLMHDDAVVS
jgi:hypothetical protein